MDRVEGLLDVSHRSFACFEIDRLESVDVAAERLEAGANGRYVALASGAVVVVATATHGGERCDREQEQPGESPRSHRCCM